MWSRFKKSASATQLCQVGQNIRIYFEIWIQRERERERERVLASKESRKRLWKKNISWAMQTKKLTCCYDLCTTYYTNNCLPQSSSLLITAQNQFFFLSSTMECFVYGVDARNILKMTLVFSNYNSSEYTLADIRCAKHQHLAPYCTAVIPVSPDLMHVFDWSSLGGEKKELINFYQFFWRGLNF